MNGGIILLDKPKGLTSFDCDKAVRKATGIRKVGHSGTLDPFATGLLPIFVGDALKFMRYTDGYDKKYRCTALFGATSDTGDSEGEITPVQKPGSSDMDKIRDALAEISKRTTQVPPKYSAKKIDGRKAYDLARQGIEFELKAVPVTIHELTVIDAKETEEGVEVVFDVHCSKGTYIRKIVTDAGELSGFGAYATELRRTMCGPFSVEDAVALDQELIFTDPETVLDNMKQVEVTDEIREDIRCGRRFRRDKLNTDAAPNELIKATCKGKLIAVIYADENGIIRIDRGFDQ
ncbi:MAG: tRNA pseudouridine(55) synthase TruB [Clostridiales bacterium]|nr:tRNA pseudouridine(55) synthase TruB [Clostridiales bacterium]